MFIAFDRITVALALLGFYTYPAMIAVVNVALGREPLDRTRVVALGLALAGMIAVVAAQLDPATGIRLDALGHRPGPRGRAQPDRLRGGQSGRLPRRPDRSGHRRRAGRDRRRGDRSWPSSGARRRSLGWPLEQPSVVPILLFTGHLRRGHPVARLPARHPGHRRPARRHPDALRAGRRRRPGGLAARRDARARSRSSAPSPSSPRRSSCSARPAHDRPGRRRRRRPGRALADGRARRAHPHRHRRRPRHGPAGHARLPRPARRPRGRRRGRRRPDRRSSVVAETRPDVVIMDLLHARSSTASRRPAGSRPPQPEVEVVALTSFIEEDRVVGAIEAGAAGFLLKDAEADDLAAAIRAAAAGEVHLDPAVAGIVARRLRGPGPGRRSATDRRATRPATAWTRLTAAGARRPGGRGPRPVQPGHRRRAGHHRAHGPDPRLEHPGQARADQPDPGRPARRRARPRVGGDRRRPDRAGGPVDLRRRRAGRRPGHRVRPRDAADPGDVGAPSCATSPTRTGSRPSTCPATARWPPTPFTLDAAADQVAAVIAAVAPPDDRRAVVVGLSLGGYVGMHLVGRHPELVRGLVLSGATAEPVAWRSLPYRGLAWVMEHVRRATPRRPQRAGSSGPASRPTVAEPIVAGGFWYAGGATALRALVGRSFVPRLAAYEGPTLFLNGTWDLPFRLSATDLRAGRPAASPGASGGGHAPRQPGPAARLRRRHPALRDRPRGGRVGGRGRVRW